jgi:hypothetical protein
VSILIELAGNPEARLDEINKRLDGFSGKKVSIGSEPANQINALAGSAQKVEGAFASAGSKITSSFENVKSSLAGLQGGIQNMMASLAGLTVGGSVSGLAWLSEAKTKLYNEQVYAAIDANKKLGVSSEQLQQKVKDTTNVSWISKDKATEQLFNIMTRGQKYVGKGDEATANADAIGKFYYSHKEMLQGQGVVDAEAMITQAMRTPGKLQGVRGANFAAALGVDVNDASMKTAKTRMKYFMEQGATIDIKFQNEQRPWDEAAVNIEELKQDIGESIAGPMALVTRGFSGFLKLVKEVPMGSALIGYAGMFVALAAGANLAVGVMIPAWTLIKAINTATGFGTALTWLFTGSKQAQAIAVGEATASEVLLTGAMEGEFLATQMTTYATNMSFASRLRLIAAKGWDTATTFANSAANFLGISSLLGLTTASTVAAGGFSLLAIAEGIAMSPLLPFVAVGLLVAGVLGLILAKAGILKPLLEGFGKINLGKVFGDLMKGDLSKAWTDITKGFKLPSFQDAFKNLMKPLELPTLQEAFKNIFGGTSIVAVLNKTFGIPLNTMIKWLDSIHSAMKIGSEFLSNVWNTLKSIWSGLLRIIPGAEKAFTESKINVLSEKKGLTFDNTTGTWKDKNGAAVENPGKTLTDLRDNWKTQTGFFEGIANALKSIIPKPTEITVNSGGLGNLGTGGPTDYIPGNPVNMAPKSQSVIDSIINPANQGYINDFYPGAASGGLITKSGGLIGHVGEPVIPAEIARSPRLLTILENIAQGNTTNNGHGAINNFNDIDMVYTGGTNGNGIYLDKFAFEREVKNIIGKCTRNYGSY